MKLKNGSFLGSLLCLSLAGTGCTKKSSEPAADTTTADSTDDDADDSAQTRGADQPVGLLVTGQLALATGLTTSTTPTHVMAFNAETGSSVIAKVGADGKFDLALDPSAANSDATLKACVSEDQTAVDRACVLAGGKVKESDIADMTDEQIISNIMNPDEDKDDADDGYDATDPTPWIIMYVNNTATGAASIISRFKSGELDTLAPTGDSMETLALGTVTPVVGAAAESTVAYADVLTKTGLSSEAADTLGAVDGASLRHSNPDINNNGKFDQVEGKKFILDFHNRFSWKGISDNAAIQYTMLKNKFPEELVGGLANLGVSYQGTGIVPELEKSEFDGAPESYRWKFDFADSSAAAVDLGNSNTCVAEDNVTTIADGAWCSKNYTEDLNYNRYQLGLEVKQPPEGTYTLEAADQTFTWTNVEVSDFSAGEGFVSMMYKIDVNDAEAITGFTYKFMKKSAGSWVAATQEELGLLLKKGSARMGMQFGSGAECGWSVPLAPTGSIVFKDSEISEACNSNTSAEIKAALENDTQPFSSLSQQPGVSYDDKMAMRFFF